MYETFGNTIAVPVKAIIDSGIISKSNYDQLVSRKKIKVLQRGCLGTPALADFSSFPERFRRVMELTWKDRIMDVLYKGVIKSYCELKEPKHK